MNKIIDFKKKHDKKFLLVIIIVLLLGNLIRTIKDCYKEEIKFYSYPMQETEQIKIDYDMGDSIYSVSNREAVYDVEYSKGIKEQYEQLKASSEYNIYTPLLIYNLYGTNKLGVNIYFTSKQNTYLEYTISVADETIPDFTRVLKNEGKNNLTKEHEYQITGFVNGYVNKLKLELKNSRNKVIATKEIILDFRDIKTYSQTVAEVWYGSSTEELEDGLYTILGNDSREKSQDYMSMYDNDGILRSEIPIIGYRSHCILFKDGYMYFSIDYSLMVKMSRLGEVVEVYDLGKYKLHHDYVFDDEEKNIILLATNTEKDSKEDVIVKIDLDTKEVTEVIDFEDMFESYVETCTYADTIERKNQLTLDWLHLNSIDYVDGDVYLSSRETSSILKVNDILTNPTLEYILSAEEIWEDTEFEDYVYEKVGDFKIHAGQHKVTYTEGEDDEVYYLTFFNNNYGKAASQPDFDYSEIGVTNKDFTYGDNSYYYVYKVNENEKIFELVDSFEVTYSSIVSSVQDLENGNVLVDSGRAGKYAEYDKDHNLIRSFNLELNYKYVYRVLKYDYKEIWFN